MELNVNVGRNFQRDSTRNLTAGRINPSELNASASDPGRIPVLIGDPSLHDTAMLLESAMVALPSGMMIISDEVKR